MNSEHRMVTVICTHLQYPADWSNYFIRFCESYIIYLTKLLDNTRDGGGVEPCFCLPIVKK